jgi:choloylglycine hydrolase
MKQWLLFFFLSMTLQGFACTGMRLTAKDGSAVHGRTLEFGLPLTISVAVVPRGYAFRGSTPLGSGLSYTAKYAALGAMAFDTPALLDGMNEKGLSVGTFFFPGYAEYGSITADNQSKGLSAVEFPNWLLTQFASLEEVKAGLRGVVIAPTQVEGWGSLPPPFHYIVYDASGKSLVIEPLKGALVVYDNPLGVFTNSPTFDWHLTNLSNYVQLRSTNVSPVKIEGLELMPFGQGSGMLGLPGDFTPPSRFVRATFFSSTAVASANAREAVLQLFHLLNPFDIPVGLVRDIQGKTAYIESTSITCVRNPSSLEYFFKTYKDQSIRRVDLKHFDLNAKKIKKMEVGGEEVVVNVSSQLR